jgi:hypothetical protein
MSVQVTSACSMARMIFARTTGSFPLFASAFALMGLNTSASA